MRERERERDRQTYIQKDRQRERTEREIEEREGQKTKAFNHAPGFGWDIIESEMKIRDEYPQYFASRPSYGKPVTFYILITIDNRFRFSCNENRFSVYFVSKFMNNLILNFK